MFSFFKKSKKGIERRKAVRYKKSFIAQCELNDSKSFSTVIDVSETGVGLLLENHIECGQVISLTLQYEFKDGAYDSNLLNIPLTGKIAWISENQIKEESENEYENHQFRAGLEISEMNKDFKAIVENLKKNSNN